MDSKRRGRHDIVGEILHYARGGRIKTHIMYKAKLSYYQIQEYLPLLLKNGFLENTAFKRKGKITKIYRTTRKGIEFLEHLESVNKLWS
jgi:predicted transcriptional regulator